MIIDLQPGQVIEIHVNGREVGSASVRTVADFLADWREADWNPHRPILDDEVYIGIVHEHGAYLRPVVVTEGK